MLLITNKDRKPWAHTSSGIVCQLYQMNDKEVFSQLTLARSRYIHTYLFKKIGVSQDTQDTPEMTCLDRIVQHMWSSSIMQQ